MMAMRELELLADKSGVRLDSWLAQKLSDISRTYVQKLIEDGFVTIGGKRVKANTRLKEGDLVHVTVPEARRLDVTPEEVELDILYEDGDILVVNKPKGMVVHPAAGNYSGTLVNALLGHCGDNLSDINGVIRPGIVHRIDKDTSGALVVAKNNRAHESMSEQLKAHDIKRVYAAIVDGVIEEDSGKIDAPIGRHPVHRKRMAVVEKGGRRAVTCFKVLERFRDATYIEATLETGRTHQIRVHMAYIGRPVLGDPVYGRKRRGVNLPGQVLHAKILGFLHPGRGEYVEFEAPLPEYFVKILEELRKGKSVNDLR